VAVELIQHTTIEGSEARFTRLCELLGDGIIGSIWMYSYNEIDTIEASVVVLPALVDALGTGAARYLKVSSNSLRR
jgi:hypothetical protein